MSSEIRANLITSRAGLSTVTMTDSGPMFSGITTFVDNSGFTFGVGGGTSIFTPSTNVLTFGTNNTEKIRIDASGHMHGVGVITATHFYGDGSNLTGISGGISTDAYGNTYGGHLAGNALTSGNDDNVIIGREAGEALNSGDDNVFIGAHAGEAATSLSDSVLIGYKAGFEGQTGSRNVIIGNGNFAIYSNDELHKCTFVGYGAGSSMQNTYNEYNTYIGYQAGVFAGADYDVAIGREAGSRSTGRFGVFIGDKAGNESGSPSDVTGQENVMIGRSAGKVSTSGGDNTLVGSQCGATLTTGSNNLILGHDADVSGATVSNEITLGDANITKFRIPGLGYVNDAGKVGIGTDNPTYKLHVDSGDAAIGLWKSRRSSGSYIDYSVGVNGAALGFIGAGGQILTGGADSGDFAIRSEGDLCFSSGGAAEKLRINSSGQVQIGNSVSGFTTKLIAGTGSGDEGITIYSGTSDNSFLHFADGNSGSDRYRGYVNYGHSDNSLQFGTNDVERARFTSSGKLLINATSGTSHFIGSGSDTLNTIFQANLGGAGATCAIRIKMNTSANNGLQIQQNGSGTSIAGGAHCASIINRENAPLRLGANNTEYFRIESNGHNYIQSQCTVRGELNMMHASQNQAKYFDIGFQGHSFNMRRTTHTDGGHSNFITVNSSKVVSGDFNDTSDGKLKKNIATITDGAIEDIKKLRPVTFDWIDETQNNNVSGFIAQEVKQVLPNLVDGTEYDPTFNDESLGSKGGIKSVGYSINSVGVTAHLTKAVQELIAKVEKLEQENVALRVRVTNLEDK